MLEGWALPDMSKLEGVICAAVTPVAPDFRIDASALARHCTAMLDAGCSHVSVLGTTGEGTSFATAEKVDALRGLVDLGVAANKQVPAIMTPALSEAADMLIAVEELGCRAALVLPPFYYGETDGRGIVEFFDAMLDRSGSTDIGLLLYNIPRFSRIAYTPRLVERLLARFGDRIVGVKDSTGDLESSLTLAAEFPDLAVFTGDDRVMPELRLSGGAGMIGGMPNLFAADAVAIFSDPTGAGTEDLRRKAAQRIVAVDGNGGLAAIKSILADVYETETFARVVPPLVPLDTAARDRLMAGLAENDDVPRSAA